MRNLILYFLLLVLGIPLNLCLNIGYKQGGFSKTLPKRGLKFVSNRGDGTIVFNLSLVLFPADVDSIMEKQRRKRDKLVACDIGRVKIILVLLTKVVALYMQTPII